jgi:hypothetical protein
MRGSREFELLTKCCRSTFAKSEATPAVNGKIEWPLFLRLARFHRVQGLVWQALGSIELEIPDEVRRMVSDDATAIAADNLRSAKESELIETAFGRAGLALLFVKGLTLAMLAYGKISTKSGVDIDILIEPSRLADASALLRQLGYRLSQPSDGTSAAKLERWHRHRKESTWLKADGGVQIDLHTRLGDNPSIIPDLGVASPQQTVEVAPGIRLPTLARDELLAYLAVHGASSAWFRLKWITDFSALIHDCTPEELERLYSRSQQLGAGRAAGQALLLADLLYGVLGGASPFKQSLERDASTRRLLRTAIRELAGATEPVEPTARPLGTLAIHYSQFLLLPGAAFKLSEFVRQARAALV